MIYLKKAVNKVSQNLPLVKQFHNNFILQLVFLSTIKEYLVKGALQQNLFVIPERVIKASNYRKKILVLDMDETLVHTRSEKKPKHWNYKQVQHEGQLMYIETRPFVKEFLQAVSQIFEIYIYTAGNKQYADLVLDQLDDGDVKFIGKRFYRDNCKKEQGIYVKDLRHLKRISKVRADMVLVDDNLVSVGRNYPFSIAVKEFEGDQKDKQLMKVFEKLLKFYM